MSQGREFVIRTAFNGRERVAAAVDDGDGRTMQEFKDECDINNILKKYQRSGLVDHVREFEGRYGDFTAAVDYQEALNITIQAQDMFMTLPSAVRNRFENDPGQFLAFANNPENEEELREMGLLPSPASAQPAEQMPAEPAPAGAVGAEAEPVSPEA